MVQSRRRFGATINFCSVQLGDKRSLHILKHLNGCSIGRDSSETIIRPIKEKQTPSGSLQTKKHFYQVAFLVSWIFVSLLFYKKKTTPKVV